LKIKYFVFIALILFTFPAFAKKRVNTVFYAQNTLGGFKNAPKSGSEKAKLLKSIGYDGLEGFGYFDFFELKKALDLEGLKMPVNYVSLNFELNGKVENPTLEEIRSMIKASAKGSVIYFQVNSKHYKDDRENGDKVAVGILQELSDFALGYKIRLCAYPHVSTYCETVAYSVLLAKQVNRKNYGAAMNLCHLLKVEGSEGIDAKIKEFIPWLFAVNICGADGGDTPKMDWDRLIQPLGQGSFDTYHFVKVLLDNGYQGPIGLQCYNLKGDAVETLTRSFQTWEKYKKRYQEEK
jgi:sugar phosphate isomerase/epimerase